MKQYQYDDWGYPMRRQGVKRRSKGVLVRDRILAWFIEYVTQNHAPPTVRDIAQAFSISRVSVSEHLVYLEREGRLIYVNGHYKVSGASYEGPPD